MKNHAENGSQNLIYIAIGSFWFHVAVNTARRWLKNLDRELMSGRGRVVLNTDEVRMSGVLLEREHAVALYDVLIAVVDPDAAARHQLVAILEWEDRVEHAGVFASLDDLHVLLASAPVGAHTDVLRGVIAGRETARGAL